MLRQSSGISTYILRVIFTIKREIGSNKVELQSFIDFLQFGFIMLRKVNVKCKRLAPKFIMTPNKKTEQPSIVL